MKKIFLCTIVFISLCGLRLQSNSILFSYTIGIEKAEAASFKVFRAKPPTHIFSSAQTNPQGLSPAEIKKIYYLPDSGGVGTVAIIGAYDSKTIEKDLSVFSQQFNLPECSVKNKCLEIHKMAKTIAADSGWNLEASMDVEWVHAIAPKAKILLVEAVSDSGSSLLDAVDYAKNRADVVSVSMSWGGPEFSDEVSLENHFISKTGAQFFASSGDNGAGVSWPASSANVIAVGGSTLIFDSNKNFTKELAWSGSGGGVSNYISEPDFQQQYDIPKAKNMRAVPDVSFNADPSSGVAVYDSAGFNKQKGWFVLGGTSAGAPAWAAIAALDHAVSAKKIYEDKASSNPDAYFRDITSGKNGTCTYYCTARKHYDYVTGIGSPVTSKF
jgi:subtilase family serine protease